MLDEFRVADNPLEDASLLNFLWPVPSATHKFVRGDLPRFDSPGSIAVSLLAFGVTMLIAEFSWRFFEHPLIKRGHRYKY